MPPRSRLRDRVPTRDTSSRNGGERKRRQLGAGVLSSKKGKGSRRCRRRAESTLTEAKHKRKPKAFFDFEDQYQRTNSMKPRVHSVVLFRLLSCQPRIDNVMRSLLVYQRNRSNEMAPTRHGSLSPLFLRMILICFML
ncbi:hypothetical protein NDU88_005618 [Pleurodeles waltl]|uniref:Uncharacterized protein n=1 Tax=Pleurodeles waltl TaxID=8319 RepID=A0AAV7WV74_PLEWA|nr:hypothetical protein NDU88_005618 [Pleurodeles waltl]